MITPAQIRAARALLGLDITDLSTRSGLSAEALAGLEATPGHLGDSPDMLAVRHALESLGITFLSDGDCPSGCDGVRLTARHGTDDGIRPENLNATNDD